MNGNTGHSNSMETKYKILISDVGSYAEDSLIKLMWVVFTHRLLHLIKGEGFRD